MEDIMKELMALTLESVRASKATAEQLKLRNILKIQELNKVSFERAVELFDQIMSAAH